MYHDCLLALAEKGSAEAYWALTEPYLAMLFNKIWLLSGNAGETRHIVSRGLIRAWVEIQNKHEQESFPALISRAVIETALARLKHGKIEPREAPFDRELVDEGGKLVEWFRALNHLQRRVIVLRYLENLTLKEIAYLLRKSEEQVATALMAALISLEI